jgi:hypothetical protein
VHQCVTDALRINGHPHGVNSTSLQHQQVFHTLAVTSAVQSWPGPALQHSHDEVAQEGTECSGSACYAKM